jgi:hypothetical protein
MGLNANLRNFQIILIHVGCLLVMEGTITLYKVFSWIKDLQAIMQLEGERLEREPISFVTQAMHQSCSLASGEETTTLYQFLFRLPAHLFDQSSRERTITSCDISTIEKLECEETIIGDITNLSY